MNDGVSTLRQRAPLVDVESKKLLVVCVPIEGIPGRKRKERYAPINLILEHLKGAVSRGFRIWSALTRHEFGEDMLRWYEDSNIIPIAWRGQTSARNYCSRPAENTRSHPPKRKLSEEYLQKLDAHDKVARTSNAIAHVVYIESSFLTRNILHNYTSTLTQSSAQN